MLLNLRDKETDALVGIDLLDIDMTLSILEEGGRYRVNVNGQYKTDDSFKTKEEAEDFLRSISLARNELESELRSYV